MAHCPFAQQALNNLIPIIEKHNKILVFKVGFVAYINEAGHIASVNGHDEIEENFRQFIISRYYPKKYIDYLKSISVNGYQGAWETFLCEAEMNGIEMSHNKAWQAFTKHITSVNERQIHSSPYILVNGKKYIASSNGKFYNDNYINSLSSEKQVRPENGLLFDAPKIMLNCIGVPAGTACPDIDGNPCTTAMCDGFGNCDQNHFELAGTGCPDTGQNDCTTAACDGAGNCDQNHFNKPAGTACLDTDGNDCTTAACNGAGNCNQNNFKPPGTACSASGNPCIIAQCDNFGNCNQNLNFAPAGAPCPDTDGNKCSLSGCDGAGGCNQNYNSLPDDDPCDEGKCKNGMCEPLPLDLIAFSVLRDDKIGVKLFWITANEINTSHFKVERSVDGKTWENIGEIAGSGWSLEERHYDFNDKVPNFGVNYYRLKMVDLDGKFEYSPILASHNIGFDSDNVVVQPNPNRGVFDLKILSNSTNEIKVCIFNQIGRVVFTETYSQQGIIYEKINLPWASSGVYLLKVDYEGGYYIRKLIILE